MFVGVFNNWEYTDDFGARITMRESFDNMRKSPMWSEMKSSLAQLWEFYQSVRPAGMCRVFLSSLSPSQYRLHVCFSLTLLQTHTYHDSAFLFGFTIGTAHPSAAFSAPAPSISQHRTALAPSGMVSYRCSTRPASRVRSRSSSCPVTRRCPRCASGAARSSSSFTRTRILATARRRRRY